MAETLLDYNPEQPLEMRYEIGGEVSATCTAFGIDEMRGNPPSVRVSPGIQAVMPLPPPKTSSFEIRVDVEGEPGANYLLSASLHQRRRLPRVRIMSGIVSDRRVEHHVLTLTALSARLRLSDFDSLGIKEWPDIAQGRIAEDILHFKYPPSPDVSESELDDERDGSDYQVWYGTNRRPEVWAGSIIDFTSARDTVVHYGRCRVSVPKSHEIGSIGSPWWKRLLRRSDDRLSVAAIQSMSEEAYWSAIAKTLSELPMGERHIVVFLHGYNVSFKDAAIRAAQLGCDLSISGVMSFFSWPSRGTYRGYLADAATIEATESFITRFLIDMANVNNASNVHVIAHSMGNRALLRAVNRVVAAAAKESSAKFNQIILAAADVDLDTFKQLASAYQWVAKRTTMYVCEKDKAVGLSEWIHDAPRAGFTPPILVVPGVDTVSVSDLDLSMLGHSYFADAKDLLQDMHR